MRRVRVVAVPVVLAIAFSCAVFAASEVFLNDSGGVARAIRITFSEPVEITGFGDGFDYQSPKGKATTFVFTGTPLDEWWTFWVSWSSDSATVVKKEWLKTGGGVQVDINIGDEPATLDPSRIDLRRNASLWVIEQLFLGLVDYDENGNVIPELATSWETSKDSTVWTFTLRDDVIWSDGVSVTAEDVRCGFLRALHPEHPYRYPYVFDAIRGAKAYYTGEASAPDGVGVKVLGEHRIQFILNRPASYFPALAVIWPFFAVPKHVVDTLGDEWATQENIVTDGTYRLVDWRHGDHISLERNEAYCDASKSQIGRVRLWMFDEQTAWKRYLQGSLDTVNVPVNHLQAIRDNQVLAAQLHMQVHAGTEFYGFNTARPPFDKLLVRKAFIAAVDRLSLMKDLEGHVLRVLFPEGALTLTPPGIFGHIDGTREEIGIPYDPEKARRWLAEAGYPDGKGLPEITLWFNTRSDLDPYHRVPAEDISRNWHNNLGVSIKLEGVPWQKYRDQLLPQAQCQVFRLGWVAHYPNANNFLRDLFRYLDSVMHLALGNWTNPEYEFLLKEAARELDLDVREDLYKRAEEILVVTDAVIMPLFYYGVAIATKPYLERTFPAFGASDIATWRLFPAVEDTP